VPRREQAHRLDISRDAPYFGFRIPGTKDKYFYVWLDAPVGYMGSFKQLCNMKGMDFDAYWKPGSDTELYHFIGKDILYFTRCSGPRCCNTRLPHADQTVRARLPHCQRREDVQIARHFITAKSYVDHIRTPSTCATTTPQN